MKIAVTDFLNAKPLIQDLQGEGDEFYWGSPHQCTKALENGEVDFALLPSIEYARIDGLSIVPGVSISSKGPVKSVVLFLKKALSQVCKIAVDERSRTAATLLKILAKESFGIEPEYIETSPDLEMMLGQYDAALLIGDHALREAAQFQGHTIDLGQCWDRLTHLPFTYAFWAGRIESFNFGDITKFIQVKDSGIGFFDPIAYQKAGGKLGKDFILDYLSKYICYDFSKSHEEGLKAFYQLAYVHGLIPRVPSLRFYEVEEYLLQGSRRKED